MPLKAVLLGLTFSFLAATCFIQAGPPGRRPGPPARGAADTAPPVRYTVAPGVNSRIVMKTLPGAVCTLRREGDTDPARGFRLSPADQDGVIRFHVRPAAESKVVGKFFVECKAGGKVKRYPLELRASPKPTAEMPAPPREGRKRLPKGAFARRALSEGEMRSLSDVELLKGGYPMRPNPKEAPKAFAAWRRAVSSPATVVKAHAVSGAARAPRPGIPNGRGKAPKLVTSPGVSVTQESSRWSGFELRGAASGTYDRVEGTWKVPFVTGPALPIPSNTPQLVVYSSIWVGLDGDPRNLPPNSLGSLWHVGTEQRATTLNLGTTTMQMAEYYAWHQLSPDEGKQKIHNFTVEDGDEVSMQIWIGNNLGQPAASPTHYGFAVQNLTRKEAALGTSVLGGKRIVGREAVWILESPASPDSVGLANYFSATVSNAHARRASSPAGQGFVPYGGDPKALLIQFRMTSDGTENGATLSAVTPVDASSMRFKWSAFR
jgi:hypothetical protein